MKLISYVTPWDRTMPCELRLASLDFPASPGAQWMLCKVNEVRRSCILKRLALLVLCAILPTGAIFGASRLKEAEKRTFELSPAVVLVTVSYQVTARFQIDDTPLELDGIPYSSTGRAFVYRPDGYIVTNGHVVADANLKDAAAQEDLRRRITHDVT